MNNKKIAIIIPCYNEGKNISLIHEKIIEQTSLIKDIDFIFFYIDDGSTDDSLKILNELTKSESRIKFISFTKNFGKEFALMSGIKLLSNVDAQIFIDSDLQHPPELIPKMIQKWKNGKLVVCARRISIKHENLIRKFGSGLFYFLLKNFSNYKFDPKNTDFRLIDKIVINELKDFKENFSLFRSLIDWMSFETEYVEFSANDRISGKSKLSFRSLFSIAINSFTNFSLLPLKLIGYLGLLITFLSIVCSMILIFIDLFLTNNIKIIHYIYLLGFSLFGIIFVGLGILALYVGYIYLEVLDRPKYIIKKKHGID